MLRCVIVGSRNYRCCFNEPYIKSRGRFKVGDLSLAGVEILIKSSPANIPISPT